MQIPLQAVSLSPQQTRAYNLLESLSSARLCAVT